MASREGGDMQEGRGGSGSGAGSVEGTDGDGHAGWDEGPRLMWSRTTGTGFELASSARPGKRGSQTGWANLPPELLSRIASFAWRETSVPQVLQDTWDEAEDADGKGMSMENIKLWLARGFMCDLRLVCRGWKPTVDNHMFWLSFAVRIDTTGRAQPLLVDLTSRRPFPSDPDFPTHFDRVRHLTRIICMTCLINFPKALVHRSSARCATVTTHLRHLPTCHLHHHSFCTHCLATDGSLVVHPKGIVQKNLAGWTWEKMYLCEATPVDIDETGQRRPVGLICHNCRRRSLQRQVAGRLKEVYGPETKPRERVDMEMLSDNVEVAASYILYGKGTAMEQAEMTVEELFLIHHTQWVELKDTAKKLQTIEAEFRDRWLENGEEETPQERHKRLELVAAMRCEGTITTQLLMDDALEMRQLKMKWGIQHYDVYRAEEEEDDDDIVYDSDDRLSKRWWRKLREAAIHGWLHVRVDFGYWVTPRDEVDQIRHERRHAPPELFAMTNIHPYESALDDSDPTPAETWGLSDEWGWIEMKATEFSHTPILPSLSLLEDAENHFAHLLRVRLQSPMRQIVAMVQALSVDKDEAEETCSKYSLDDILMYLAKKETWIKGGLLLLHADEIKAMVIEREERKAAKRSSEQASRFTGNGGLGSLAAEGRAGLGERSQSPPKEPRIELVTVEPIAVDYGIREILTSSPAVSSVTMQDHESEERGEDQADPLAGPLAGDGSDERASLGKRKEAPADLEHLPHKKASLTFQGSRKSEQVPGSAGAEDTLYAVQTEGSVSPTRSCTPISTARDSTDATSERTSASRTKPMDSGRSHPSYSVEAETTEDHMSTQTETAPPSPPRIFTPSPSPEVAQKGPRLIMPVGRIPWIPKVKGEGLGPGARKIIMDLWYEIREPLRTCQCSVCERRREWDLWTEP